MITEQEYFKAINIVNQYNKQLGSSLIQFGELKKSFENPGIKSIAIIGMSLRLYNAIKKYDNENDTVTHVVSDMSLISFNKIKHTKNVGSKTIQEFETLLRNYDVVMLP